MLISLLLICLSAAAEPTIPEFVTNSSKNIEVTADADIPNIFAASNETAQEIMEGFGSYSRLSHRGYNLRSSPVVKDEDLYDYIIIGAGASGCSIARTLADGKMKVLLIERGPKRSYEETPLAMDAYGVGLSILDPQISQVIQTPGGIRTNVASVTGGGTGINVGMMINAEDNYYDHLQKLVPNLKWDRDLLRKSYAWIGNKTSVPSPAPDQFEEALTAGLNSLGYKVYNADNKVRRIPEASTYMQPGHVWRSYTIFNATNNFTRNAADTLLWGPPNYPKLPTLTVKTRTNVQKIEFDTSTSTPKAVCVLYQDTTKDDIAPLVSRKTSFYGLPYEFGDWIKVFFLPDEALTQIWSRYYTRLVSQQGRACIRKNGRIIVAAGAVLTPILLFESGVGPREQIEELNIPLIKEIPQLGKEFSDRVLVPVVVFGTKPLPAEGYPPHAGNLIALSNLGPDCANFKIGDKTLKCSPGVVETLSGARMAEGIFLATRYFIPPQFRNDPIVDVVFSAIKNCDDKTPYSEELHSSGVCAFLDPATKCARRGIANFHFTAQPKSRGYVSMKRTGEVTVEPNYMADSQDLFDAIRTVATLIDIVNSDHYAEIIEPLNENSCPMKIMNGFLDLLLHFGTQISPYAMNHESHFEEVIRHMSDLIPADSRRPRRLLINDKVVTANESHFNKLRVSSKLKRILLAVNNEDDREEHKNDKSEATDTKEMSCATKDIYHQIFGCDSDKNNTTRRLFVEPDELIRETLASIIKNNKNIVSELRANEPKYSKRQWAASFPPVLPDTSDPKALANFVFSYMTSVWHHTGTAQLGKVVNSRFEVMGIDNLSIVDASVLPVVTPFNPTSTILSIARYAGIMLLKDRNIDVSEILEN